MPSPWLSALRLIPWTNLLSNGPAVAHAADALLSGTKERKAQTAGFTNEVRALAERVAALETHDRAGAELSKQMSDQIAALTKAAEVMAVRQRWLLILAATALVGVFAVLLFGR